MIAAPVAFSFGGKYGVSVGVSAGSCPTAPGAPSGQRTIGVSGVAFNAEVTGSDDLLGLMRGFLYAGARSLLLSLWNVNDESTAALMVNFYREWQKGTDKSKALRQAMLMVRNDHPNPFYWAPFLLVGNP